MLKSIGFRNSGALDLSGKGVEIGLVVVIILIIILAIAVVIGVSRNEDGSPLETPKEARVKCLKCGEEWMIDSDEMGNFMRESRDRAGGRSMGGDCPKCQAKGTVYIMIKCPKCGTYYMPKKATDPLGAATGEARDVCPKCGTDYVKWFVEQHRRK